MTRHLLTAAIAASLFALPAAAGAATHCVSTASQLRSLLSTLSSTLGGTHEVRIRAGSYTTAQAGGMFALQGNTNQQITISGGWSGVTGTCTSQSADAGATVLDGGGTGAVLYTAFNNGDGGTLTVANLTVRNGYSDQFLGACLQMQLSAGSTTLVDRIRAEHCRAVNNGGAASLSVSAHGNATIRNSLFTDADALGGATVVVSAYTGATVHFLHNTVFDSISTMPDATTSGASLQTFDQGVLIAANNIFWAQDPVAGHGDVYVYGPGTRLYRNHYGSLGGTTTVNVAPTSGNPQFVAGAVPRLAPDSMLVDSGITPPSGNAGPLDLDGRTRVTGDAPDLGAFEYAELFASGFE